MGYEAYDVDEGGFKAWYSVATNMLATDQRAWGDTTIEWRERYKLKIERAKVQKLATKAHDSDTLVFLCGTTPNDEDIWDLFDKVIHLSIDDDTMRHRLATRTTNDYGKHPDELRNVLRWNKTVDGQMKSLGAVIIDATLPLDEVVQKILKEVS